MTTAGVSGGSADPGDGSVGSSSVGGGGLSGLLWRVTESLVFRGVVVGLIVLAGVVVGLETYFPPGTAAGDALLAIDWVIVVLFTVEVAMRMGAYGRRPWRYFGDPWNVFDFVIVAVCWLPVGGHYAAVLRLARVARLMRLFSAVPRLQVIVAALFHAVPSIAYVAVLMGLLFYMYAVVGVSLFGKNDPVHFGTLHDASISLFRTVTLEDWTDLLYINMLGSAEYGYEGMESLTGGSRGQPVVAVVYFVSFVLLGTMIVLNLFIGVVLSSMSEAQAVQAKRLAARRAAKAAALGDERGASMESVRAELDELALESERLGERARALRLQLEGVS